MIETVKNQTQDFKIPYSRYLIKRGDRTPLKIPVDEQFVLRDPFPDIIEASEDHGQDVDELFHMLHIMPGEMEKKPGL